MVHGVEREALRPIGAGRYGRLGCARAAALEGTGVVEHDRSVRVGKLVGPPHRNRGHNPIGSSRTTHRYYPDRAHGRGPDSLRKVFKGAERVVVVRYRVDVIAAGSADQCDGHCDHHQYHDDERDGPHPLYSTLNRPCCVDRGDRHTVLRQEQGVPRTGWRS